jgi:adenosylcobinamide-GDP ribazoletransferase
MKAFNMQGPQPTDNIQAWRDDLSIALAFLTRLPVRAPDHWDPGMLVKALRLSPAVGAFVGAFAGSFYWLAVSFGFSTFIAAVLGIAAAALLTGGLHEDALSDMADGISGGWTVERKLEIMSDGRIGAHGALALMLALLLRVGAMAQISAPDKVMAALIAAGALSRAIMYAAMATLPYAKQTGLAHDVGRPSSQQAAIALGLGFAIAWLALPFGTTLTAFIGGGAAGLFVALMAKRHIGGQTGDVLGAVQQISELCALLLLAGMLTG